MQAMLTVAVAAIGRDTPNHSTRKKPAARVPVIAPSVLRPYTRADHRDALMSLDPTCDRIGSVSPMHVVGTRRIAPTDNVRSPSTSGEPGGKAVYAPS